MTDTEHSLRQPVMDALSTVYDPEVPVDIVNFGLIYGLEITDGNDVKVTMSLTSPTCPAAQSIPEECERKIGGVEGVNEVEINIVWEPPWGPEMISPEGREKLGMD
ncbi:MAG: metal-sulfur cluster assembly factor [Planctomycetota bacterium]|jgi:FeS assembly SUF system protein|nr:metal-sulfur cluster assembly factor [Planctomycetota bacterium]